MTWTMRRRRRILYNGLSQPNYARQFYSYDPSVTYYSSPFTLNGLQIQETEDVDRKVHPRSKSSRDSGGPFKSKKLDITFDRLYYKGKSRLPWTGGFRTLYEIDGFGALRSTETDPYLSFDVAAINALYASISFPGTDLASYGNKALLRVDPTRGVVQDPSEFIFELVRDGIPQLPTKLVKTLQRLRGAGKDYLSVQFGWLPFLRDTVSLVETYYDIERRIAQLQRDSGQSVRRTGTLKHEKSSTPVSWSGGFPQFLPNGPLFQDTNITTPIVRAWTETEERVWFAGKGSYILPIDLRPNPMQGKRELFLSALAQSVSPSSVWELLPWSWLIDYFTNIGEVIRRAAGHGLGTYTLDYCYLMRQVTTRTSYTVSNYTPLVLSDSSPGGNVKLANYNAYSCVITKTTKERIAATPFGFGLNTSSLSASQYAILTALGLSRQNFL